MIERGKERGQRQRGRRVRGERESEDGWTKGLKEADRRNRETLSQKEWREKDKTVCGGRQRRSQTAEREIQRGRDSKRKLIRDGKNFGVPFLPSNVISRLCLHFTIDAWACICYSNYFSIFQHSSTINFVWTWKFNTFFHKYSCSSFKQFKEFLHVRIYF